MSFVHLHTHTHYSFLQGLGTPKKLAFKAKELGMTAVALTDAWNLYGAFEFYKYSKEAGVKPIIGVEFTIARKWRANKDKDNDTYQIVVLAKNFDGYLNLIQMVSESYLTGFYFRPRIDFELLQKYGNNCIALSGNHTGEIAQHVTTGQDESFIVERIRYYESVFGKGNFYLELLEHPDRGAQTKVNDTFVKLARSHGFPLVAANDAFYLKEEDGEAQDLLFCIGDGRSLEDPDRPTLIEGNYALRSMEEMRELFAYAPDAIENTLKIADSIELEIPYGKTLIPTFTLAEKEQKAYEQYKSSLTPGLKVLDPEEWNLRDLCYSGLNYRFDFGLDRTTIDEFIHKKDLPPPEKKLSAMSLQELEERARSYQTDRKKEILTSLSEERQKIVDRLEYELTVVDLMGFNGYFNIVSDFINWAKDHDVPVGPWRGSAAGALLAYLSGITDIDPLRYGLLFERFLNPARISMPDIDVDFSDEGRDKVLEYVRNKYGADHVAQICTFGTMAARAAVKDVGKALGIPFSEMNKLASYIPARPGTKLSEALIESTEFKEAYETDDRYHKVIDNALKLEGSVRQLGVHACAVIIAPEPMTNYCALQHPPKDSETIVTQLSQYPLEDLGLLKMDFLGLRNLTIIKRCLEIIKNVHEKDINLLKINYEDKKVFKIFAEGDTTGVFQFESAGMRKYLRELRPNTFEDIIVMVSLYRPGPLAYIPTYIGRKHGREKVAYPHPSLEAILKPTQGIAVYQEQIMQLVQAFAGFSLGEADILRRAIGKKKVDLLMEQKEKFIAAANAEGHSTELAKYIFEDIIEPFAGYGFNKSHAACYSMISYQTAFLKAYYPTEFMTALMVSDEDDMERITMEIEECKAKGIAILPPDVNESMKHFTFIDNGHIRFGLKAIKGLGDGPIESIQSGRKTEPYKEVLDFITRTNGDVINKKSLEALILSGALDRFGERASLMASIPKMIAYAKENSDKASSSQIGLFDLDHGHDSFHALKFSLERTPPMDFENKIKGEKASIGYSISGHGLDGLKPFIDKRTIGKEHVTAFLKKMAEQEEMALEDEDGNVLEVEKTAPKENVATEAVAEADEKTDKKKEREKQIRVRFVGLVTSVRKVQTKTGKLMAVANCDSTDFRFSIVVFPKDYELLGHLLVEDTILLAEGILKCNEENSEISVIANSLKSNSISAIRSQAQEMGLFDPRFHVSYYRSDSDEESTEQKQNDTASNRSYKVFVPKTASKQDLIDLKAFLTETMDGTARIILDIAGKEIDTKLAAASLETITKWVSGRWKGAKVVEV